MKKLENSTSDVAGLLSLTLRWVIGWTYFSAFWRRLILDNKLIPEEAGYIGEKFNHFLPNALGIKPIIEYLVSNPEALHISMIVFTIVEAIVGLFLILGLFSRLMSIGVFGLAMGILLGSGWIGTTCLDEWQIGVLGVAGGFTLFLSGGGHYSLDNWMQKKQMRISSSKYFTILGSGSLQIPYLPQIVLAGSIGIFALTLFTNQYFHGGVYGTLHNKSVKPRIEIGEPVYSEGQLKFSVFRVEGADVYGSFLIGMELKDAAGVVIYALDQSDLSTMPEEQIQNYYVAKVKPGKHSLIIPLGAKADIILNTGPLSPGNYQLRLLDISGAEWSKDVVIR